MIIQSLVTGIFATTLMTVFLYLAAFILKKRLQVIHILGTMVTGQTTISRGLSKSFSALFTGTILHYLVGVFFAFIFGLLTNNGITDYHPGHCIIYGIIIGALAIAVWWLFITIHPHPPQIPLRIYLSFIFISHLVFALGLCWSYRLL